MLSSTKAYLFALVAVVLFASAAAVAKLLLGGLDNLQLLFFSSFFAMTALLVILVAQKKRVLVSRLSARDWLKLSLLGFIGVFLYHVFYFGSLSFIPAQQALTVNYLWPVLTMLFAIPILKEPFSSRKLAAIMVSFVGVLLVVSQGNFSSIGFGNANGILLAFLGAVFYGLFSAFGKKLSLDTTVSMFVYLTVAFVCSLIAVLFFSSVPVLSLTQWVGVVWLGAFSIGLGFLAWFLALKYGDTAKIANLVFLSPFVSLVFVFFLVGEAIAWSSVVGLILIVSGIFIQNSRTKSKK